MSATETKNRGIGRFILNPIFWLILVAILVPVAFMASAPREKPLRDTLRSVPPFTAIEQHFPQEAERLLREIEELQRKYPGADARSRAQQRLAEFIAQKSLHLRSAPDPALAAITVPRLAMLEYLRSVDPALCGRFATGEIVPDDAARLADAEFAARSDGFFRAMFAAARQGADRPQGPPVDTLAPEIWTAINEAMAAQGASAELIRLSSDDSAFAQADAPTQCDVSIAELRAVAALPLGQNAAYQRYTYSG